MSPAEQRGQVEQAQQATQGSQRRVCRALGWSRASVRYRVRRSADSRLAAMLRELAEGRQRFGCRRLWALLRRQGERVNRKRVYRVYRAEGLHLRKPARRRRPRGPRGVLLPCSHANQRWSLDFMHETLWNGRKVRLLNVLDDCTRECLCIEVSTGFSGAHVARVLERLCQQRQVPEVIRSDNGPEFTSDAVQSWAKWRGLRWHCIEPDKPTQNSHIERFNGRVRDECLNQNLWRNIEEVRQETAEYRRDYNHVRPHGALGYLSPVEYARRLTQVPIFKENQTQRPCGM